MTRYIALTVDKKEICDANLGDIGTKRILNSFTNPSNNSTAKATNGESQFIPASKEPTKEQIKKLIDIAISVGSDVSMENHVYSIDGEVRR